MRMQPNSMLLGAEVSAMVDTGIQMSRLTSLPSNMSGVDWAPCVLSLPQQNPYLMFAQDLSNKDAAFCLKLSDTAGSRQASQAIGTVQDQMPQRFKPTPLTGFSDSVEILGRLIMLQHV